MSWAAKVFALWCFVVYQRQMTQNLYLMTSDTFPRSNINDFKILEEMDQKNRETTECIMKINAVLCEKEKLNSYIRREKKEKRGDKLHRQDGLSLFILKKENEPVKQF